MLKLCIMERSAWDRTLLIVAMWLIVAMVKLREAMERVRMASEDGLSMRVEEWYREREAFRAAVERELEAAERLDMAKQDPYHN